MRAYLWTLRLSCGSTHTLYGKMRAERTDEEQEAPSTHIGQD